MTTPAVKEPLMLRIPLPGDVDGVVVTLPDRYLSVEQFEHLMHVLDVMRPGLVAEPATAEAARCPTCRARRDDLTALALVCPDHFHARTLSPDSVPSESESA